MVREGCAETAAALAADKRAIVRMGSVERGKEERKQGGGDGEEGRGREKQGRGGKGEGGEGKRCARALREKFPGYPATLKSANLTLTGEIFASVGSKSTRDGRGGPPVVRDPGKKPDQGTLVGSQRSSLRCKPTPDWSSESSDTIANST